MAGTKESAKVAAETNKKKNPNYYADIGSEGGRTITNNTHRRGFGSMTIERRREIGRMGAAKRIANLRSNG